MPKKLKLRKIRVYLITFSIFASISSPGFADTESDIADLQRQVKIANDKAMAARNGQKDLEDKIAALETKLAEQSSKAGKSDESKNSEISNKVEGLSKRVYKLEDVSSDKSALEDLKSELRSLKVRPSDVPIGTIMAYAGNRDTIPEGYLVCDGSWVDRMMYPDLYDRIQETYSGQRSSKNNKNLPSSFRLPDIQGRALVGVTGDQCRERTSRALGEKFGSESHRLTEAEMPRHTHEVSDPGHCHGVNDPGHFHQFGCNQRASVVEGHSSSIVGGDLHSNTRRTQTDISIKNSYTGIELEPAGKSQAFDICQPSIAILYLIKAR